MEFSKGSLQGRILLGFGIIGLMVILVSSWTIINVSRIRTTLTESLTHDLRNIELISGMRVSLHRHHRAALLYLLGQRDTSRAIAVHAQEQFMHNLELSAAAAGDDSTSRAVLREIRESYRQFLIAFSRLDEFAEVGQRPEALGRLYMRQILPPVDEINDELLEYRQHLARRTIASIDDISRAADFTVWSTVAISALLVALCIFGAWRASRSILRPIRRLGVSVQKIAEGDYRQTIDPGDAFREFAELVGHFNTLSIRLGEQEAVNRRMLATAQLRAEKIVRDLPDLTIVTDAEGRVIYFNQQAEQVLGLPARRVIGTLLAEHAAESRTIAQMNADLAWQNVDTDSRFQTIVVGGAERTFSYGIQTVRSGEGESEEGEIVGYLFRMQDVTNFRKIDDLRRKMISTVSHELRTPLTSMGMSLELLLEEGMVDNLDQVQRELLHNLHEDVHRLGAFVNDLLDLSRIDTGQATFRIVPNAPRALADEVVRRFTPISMRQEIQIDSTGVPHDLPLVLADAERISQVFSNLLSNAIRYTPFRGTISVGAAADGGFVRFWVRDNGPGIAPDEAERVFERFYQIRDDQRAGGSGLGLSIVKEIVEAHGGRVWVQSAAGFGSTFYFTLPQAAEEATPESARTLR